MKKIALITDGWKRYVTYAWVEDTAALLPFSGRTVLSVPYVCAMVATSLYVSFLILT